MFISLPSPIAGLMRLSGREYSAVAGYGESECPYCLSGAIVDCFLCPAGFFPFISGVVSGLMTVRDCLFSLREISFAFVLWFSLSICL